MPAALGPILCSLPGPKEGHRKSCRCLLGCPLSAAHQKSLLLQQQIDKGTPVFARSACKPSTTQTRIFVPSAILLYFSIDRDLPSLIGCTIVWFCFSQDPVQIYVQMNLSRMHLNLHFACKEFKAPYCLTLLYYTPRYKINDQRK